MKDAGLDLVKAARKVLDALPHIYREGLIEVEPTLNIGRARQQLEEALKEFALAELTAEAQSLGLGYETRAESVGNWAKAVLNHPFKQLLEILKRCRDLQIETNHRFNGGNPFVEYMIFIGKRAYSGRTLGEAIGLALQEEKSE